MIVPLDYSTEEFGGLFCLAEKRNFPFSRFFFIDSKKLKGCFSSQVATPRK